MSKNAAAAVSLVIVMSACRPRAQAGIEDSDTAVELVAESFASGGRKAEGGWLINRKEGLWLTWTPDGRIQSKGIFSRGRMTGLWVFYSGAGLVSCLGYYFEGKRQGPWLVIGDQGGSCVDRSGYYDGDVLVRDLTSVELEELGQQAVLEDSWHK